MIGDSRPIGVFDSGVGGLSVLGEIRALLPAEDVLYVADQRFAPYGERSLEDVRIRATQVAGQMIESGVKVIVVACNSASAAALHQLRETFHGMPFVGMEPAVKPAALESTTGVVGVIATRATFQGELFASVVDRHANGVEVLTRAAPSLVELVEEGLQEPASAREELRSILAPMVAQRMDTLVLGCTHYSFLAGLISDVLGDEVTIVDPAGAVARQVGRVLGVNGLRATGSGRGTVEYRTTLDPDRFAAVVERLTGSPIESRPMRW